MIRYLLDSCIYIDVLRNNLKALEFIETIDTNPTMSVATILELYHGARSVSEENNIERLIAAVDVKTISPQIGKQAGLNLKHYARSHNIDVPDAVIGATATYHELELVTLNIKHFPMFPGLKQPY